MLTHVEDLAAGERQERLQWLSQLPLFDGLPENVLNHFAEKSYVMNAEKGKVLFLRGDEAQWFYAVMRGWVKLFRETVDGTEAVIDVLNEGCLFGESSAFDEAGHPASAEVVDEARLLVLPTSLLRYYLEKEQGMAMNLLSGMARQRRLQQEDIEHLNVQNAPQRIGCFILRLCHEIHQGPAEWLLPYDKTLIAARLGMKPETFSRALAKLKDDVGLEIKGSHVAINAVERLVDYTCNHCSSSFPCETHDGDA